MCAGSHGKAECRCRCRCGVQVSVCLVPTPPAACLGLGINPLALSSAGRALLLLAAHTPNRGNRHHLTHGYHPSPAPSAAPQVRELVRSLRPGTRDATAASSARAAASLEQLITPPPSHNSTSPSHTQSGQLQQQAPGTPFSGAASGGPLAAGAAAGVGAAAAIGGGAGGGGAAAVSAVAAAEAKSLFLAEGGVLVLMELLDTDNQKVCMHMHTRL